jgi:RNA polymerase sigma-70 factor (ECF subfamily)
VAGGQVALGSPAHREAVEEFARLYWRPVYAYLRLRCRRTREEAMDTTQEFFLGILEGRWLPNADRERGSFRAFIRTCLDTVVKMEIRCDNALKRGGGSKTLSIDWGEDPDRFLIRREGDSPEEVLNRHWRTAILQEALRKLEGAYHTEGRSAYFHVYRDYTMAADENQRPTYDELATRYGIARTDVTNFLNHARRRLRDLVRDTLQASVAQPNTLGEEEREFYAENPWK